VVLPGGGFHTEAHICPDGVNVLFRIATVVLASLIKQGVSRTIPGVDESSPRCRHYNRTTMTLASHYQRIRWI
jgi:hypothetical protein